MTRTSAPSISTWTDAEFTVDELVTLTGPEPSGRVSVYLPTHRSGREAGQDAVRLRHLLRSAAEEITDGDLLTTVRALEEVDTMLPPGFAGAALLVETGAARVVGLAEPVRELWTVSDRYHLTPLIQAIQRRLEFDILALSRQAARVVRVTGSRAEPLPVPDLPAGMADALRWDDRERQLQSHAAGRTGAGTVAAAFHGQGGSADTRLADLERYLHLVDHAVGSARAGSERPLVLAGVDDIVAVFRRVTRCSKLVDGHIAGNPDQRSDDELADRARPLVPRPTAAAEQRARDAFLAGAAATVDTVEQAVVAAAAGQVETLFVAADRPTWGRYRDGHTLIERHDERQPGDHDLTDVAASETLRHRGTVHLVDDDVPGGGTAAAVLHF